MAVTVSVAPAVAWAVPIVDSAGIQLEQLESPDDEMTEASLNSDVVTLFVCAVEKAGSFAAPAVVGLVLSAAQPELPCHLVVLIALLVLKPT